MTPKHLRPRPAPPVPATLTVPALAPWLIAVLALAGLALSAYLTTLHYTASQVLFCSAGSSCDIVQNSKYATLFGVPVALAGALGFSAILATLLWAWKRPERWPFFYALAKHLTRSGAVTYGAYWCPHCADQKSMFGDAFRYVTYVECDPRGERPNPALCNQKGVYLYPTWEVGGRMYTGVMSLEQLALLTGYTPPP